MERIDTHAHFVPPSWRALCEQNGYDRPDGMPDIPEWDVDEHLQLMKDLRIKKTILSITSPGTYLVEHLARETTRECNEFAAEKARKYPGKFGFWASLPLPDVVGSLKEIEYALDTLGADGVTMLTNHRGRYLGDPEFDAVFAELNKRKAKVFVHPTTPCMRTNNVTTPCTFKPDWPAPVSEFLFEDARGVMNLFFTGTSQKYTDITYIISHAGGALFPLINRFSAMPNYLGMTLPEYMDTEVVKAALNDRFYFDLAGFVFPHQILALVPQARATRLFYGTDYPYIPGQLAEQCGADMDKYLPKIFPDTDDQENVCYRNAERLLGSS